MDRCKPALFLRLQPALDTYGLFWAVAARIAVIVPHITFFSIFDDAVSTDGLIADWQDKTGTTSVSHLWSALKISLIVCIHSHKTPGVFEVRLHYFFFTYEAIVLLDFQNVTHVSQAAGGEPVGVLLNLGGGLWVHQKPPFAFGYLRVAAVKTLIVLKMKHRDTKCTVKCKTSQESSIIKSLLL